MYYNKDRTTLENAEELISHIVVTAGQVLNISDIF